jgi:Leucine-rich repeat (LRR) protein
MLDVSSNRLTLLPAELGQLTNLQELYLDRNKLTSLPQSLASSPTFSRSASGVTG